MPIYLKPHEYLDSDQHSFLLLQLYYLYCKFKNSKPQYQPPELVNIVFRDEGRILEDNSQTSGGGLSNATPQRSRDENDNNSSEFKPSSMGVIDEVDSGDFSSTMKSKPGHSHTTSSVNQLSANQERMKKAGKINQQKVMQFLSQAQNTSGSKRNTEDERFR